MQVTYSNDQCIFLMILQFSPTSSKKRSVNGTHLPTLSIFQIIPHDIFQYAILYTCNHQSPISPRKSKLSFLEGHNYSKY